MGLFGNKQQDQPVYQDEPASQTTAGQTQTIDGLIASSPTPDPSGTSAPMMDGHMHDDDFGSYIMADPPASSSSESDQTAKPEVIDAPAFDTSTFAPSEPEATTEVSANDQAFQPEPVEQPEVKEEAGFVPAEEAKPVTSSTDLPGDTLDDLADIKRQALEQLSPLVSHLDQSPEEKFRTTLMLLQSTDDKKFIKQAYQAAQEITDDKARANALMEIIKEVDYFTSK